ncbi:hypothetical protein BpHYR1_051265 [Brachionus plicatilis]|uniref:Uncharacterized protein n=1 Tax=Brachionus plicatilis TaxID=10195 RepID=A0A3M7SQV9_BRAPC|nr:hypothetical protein BpHYR1_051265 [Brachionus plicatilis]
MNPKVKFYSPFIPIRPTNIQKNLYMGLRQLKKRQSRNKAPFPLTHSLYFDILPKLYPIFQKGESDLVSQSRVVVVVVVVVPDQNVYIKNDLDIGFWIYVFYLFICFVLLDEFFISCI